jgi:hypothetical protein
MNITFTSTNDWNALYIDGKLALDDSEISAKNVLDALGIKWKEIDLSDEFIEKVEECGIFPKNEKDLNDMNYFKKGNK